MTKHFPILTIKKNGKSLLSNNFLLLNYHTLYKFPTKEMVTDAVVLITKKQPPNNSK